MRLTRLNPHWVNLQHVIGSYTAVPALVSSTGVPMDKNKFMAMLSLERSQLQVYVVLVLRHRRLHR